MTSSARSLRIAAAAAALRALAHAKDVLSTDPTDSDAAPRAVAGPGPIDPAAALRALNAAVLYSSVATSPTSNVPGITPTIQFTGTTAAFQRLYGTKGGRWHLKADSNAATTADDLLLVDGVVELREGDQAPWTAVPQTMGPFEARNGLTDNGGLAVKNNTSATTNDDYVAKFTGGVWTIVAQEASQIGAMPAGVTYDDTLTSVVLLDSGDVCFEADGIDGPGITTTIDEVFVREGATDTLFAQELVTIPSSQFTGLSETIDNIGFDDVWFTPDGANYVMKADLTGLATSDDVIIYNGAVVLQEGFDVPGIPGRPDRVGGDRRSRDGLRGQLVGAWQPRLEPGRRRAQRRGDGQGRRSDPHRRHGAVGRHDVRRPVLHAPGRQPGQLRHRRRDGQREHL